MISGTLILSRADVEALLGPDECFSAVEEAFLRHGDGSARQPGVLGVPARGGGFHLKAGTLGEFFAAKVNGNFSGNDVRGLPRIQGVVLLSDAETGTPLAVMDSAAITRLRTASATAVAAKWLAREDSGVLTIVGCGVQGQAHLSALARVFEVRRVFCFDEKEGAASRLAAWASKELEVPAAAARDLRAACLVSDIVVTCTPSKRPLLFEGFLRRGTFLAAVGADSEDKQEIDAALLASSAVVTDVTAQCAAIGDLHHALVAGRLRREDVRAELGEVVSGRKAGRRSPEEIVIFDSTGTALQDVAAAAVVHAGARREHRGVLVDLAS